MAVRGGWRYPIAAGRWEERLQQYEDAVAGGFPLQHMVDIARSVIASGRASDLGSVTSHYDLVVAAQPADTPPLDVVVVRTPFSLGPAKMGCVRIEHHSLTGTGDSIERPAGVAVALFWRFVVEKFGIAPAAAPDIDWDALRDAYGSAGDVPELLAAGADSPVPSDGVWDELWGRLCHQGTVYSASLAAIPMLAKMTGRGGAGGYSQPLQLAAAIIASVDGPPELPGARSRYASAVAELRRLTEQGLALAGDDTEFVYALQALMAFEDGGDGNGTSTTSWTASCRCSVRSAGRTSSCALVMSRSRRARLPRGSRARDRWRLGSSTSRACTGTRR